MGDLLEQEAALEALRKRERELSDFIENAPMGMHWVGPDGVILWANQYELDLLGYGREEYIGHHIREFHADPGAIEEVLKRLAAGETLQNYEVRLIHKDGSIRHVLISSNVLWDADRFVHTGCFTRDITDRKVFDQAFAETEERFMRFMRHLPGAAWIKDIEGRYVYANPVAERIFRTPLRTLLGKTDHEVFPPETARLFRDNDLRALTTGEGVEVIETPRS